MATALVSVCVYVGLFLLIGRSKEKSLAVLCAVLLFIAALPGVLAGYIYAKTGYINEGVGAAYWLSLVLLLPPLIYLAAVCFERSGSRGTNRFKLICGALFISALLLMGPLAVMRGLS
jgi:hypothetical protein